MANTQNPQKTGILKFLKESVGNQFVIPVYQRKYTWTAKKEVKQYLDDLTKILTGEYENHFLGILIYLDIRIDYRTGEFQIIDGQQRLTTIFLSLYALKDIMFENGHKNEAVSIENQYLVNNYVDEKFKLKLKPLVSDDDIYQKIVYKQFKDINNKKSNVYKNYIYLKKYFSQLLEKYTTDQIFQALEKLYVVTIPVETTDSPQKIFESINSTGAKLSPVDLIRNFILMDIASEKQEKLYDNYWKSIEDYVGYQSKQLEAFFRSFIACKTYDMPTSSATYSSFKKWYIDELKTLQVDEILDEIKKYARIYHTLKFKKPQEIDKEIRQSIVDFRRIPSELPIVFYLAIINLYEKTNKDKILFTSKQINETFSLFSTYLIRRFICGLDTSDNKLFTTFLKEVMKECDGDYSKYSDILKQVVINKQQDKITRMPDNEEFIRHLREDNLYINRLWLKVIFERIEGHNNDAPVEFDRLSIEHLMPQTPTKEWLDALHIDREQYAKNLNKLGNLTLAAKIDNSKMSNKPFEYKKAILQTTQHIKLNQDIYNLSSWGIDEINKRTEKLIKETLLLFPYICSNNDVVNKINIAIEKPNIKAKAIIFVDDGSVEILAGSQLLKYNSSSSELDEIEDLYFQLIDEGTIKENENNSIFLKDYLITKKKYFDSLMLAESLIMGGKQTKTLDWRKENGEKIKLNLTNEKFE